MYNVFSEDMFDEDGDYIYGDAVFNINNPETCDVVMTTTDEMKAYRYADKMNEKIGY